MDEGDGSIELACTEDAVPAQKGIPTSPVRTQRSKPALLIKFLLFHTLLPLVDIVTDIVTAVKLAQQVPGIL